MKKTLVFILLLGLSLFIQQDVLAAPQPDGVKTVVIDAGHGGHDPGNLGTKRYKTTEKDIALAVALKVGKYIEDNFDDVKVIYTRKSDVFVDLQKRADIANKAEADLFISIHCDAFHQSSVFGATTLVMGRNHDDDNLRVAMRENSVIYLEENYEEKYEGFDPNNPASYIAFTLYQSTFMNQSVSFAQKVQDQFRERVQRRDRGVKQQPLMVTKMAVMPAVLIELGFLTNPTEEDYLRSEQGQTFMASAIYRAFRDYKEEREQYQLNAPKEKPTLDDVPPTPQSLEEAPSNNIEKDKGPAEQASGDEVYYTIQIITSGLKKDLTPENFRGVEGVNYYQEKGLYKYTVGKLNSLEAAEALRQKMKDSGFKDAFVVALAGGKRIPLEEASKLLE